MKKTIASMLVLVLILAMIIPTSAISVDAATGDDVERYGDVLDVGRFIRADGKDEALRAEMDNELKKQALELNPEEGMNSAGSRSLTVNSVGQVKTFMGYDNGGYYLKKYTLRSLGNNVEVWVANDLGFYAKNDISRYLPDPFGRAPYVVTDEQANMMKDTFDNIIYPTDTDFFGMPDSHNGANAYLEDLGVVPDGYYEPEDGVERTILLVDNVRDEQFYDPSYPFFVAGFYSPSFETYFDRNVISLDAKDWATRLENTYYGTAAHEFQHLIHDDNDFDEENWINEGMADYAEYLCFGEHAWGHINFFLDHPENSLVEWDEQYNAATGPETLADYGQAYLMQLYINEKYGKEFVRALAKNELNGIESVNDQFAKNGIDMNFEELFRRFTIAVAIDDPQTEGGIYNFDTIDLKVDYESALLFDKDGVPAWGADYKKLDKANKIYSIKIDGIDFLPSPWKVVDKPGVVSEKALWGGEGHMRDNMLIFEADLGGLNAANLTFDNYYNIEDGWDAGMVQVSEDNGATWKSLANNHTTAQADFPLNEDVPQIYENMPGFTGKHLVWTEETFDLSDYAGKQILISFRYMTDAAANEIGWYIDNISIPEIGYTNDCDSTDGFKSLDEILGIDVDYALTFINEKSKGTGKSIGKGIANVHYDVLSIDPMNITEADAIKLKGFLSGGNNYMIVWYAAPVGKMGPVDFSYQIVPKSDAGNKKPTHAKH